MNILLVDDHEDIRSSLAGFLGELGHRVREAATGPEAMEICAGGEIRLIIADIMMPGMSGIELLQEIRSLPGGWEVEVVLVTGYGDLKTAVEALRLGARDYLFKPVDVEELAQVVERTAGHRYLRRENAVFTHRSREAVALSAEEAKQEPGQACGHTVGRDGVGIFSPAMEQVFSQAASLHTDRSLPVLIEGETGTGKELVARSIHYGPGTPAELPFVDLNCAALSPAMFESELFGYEAGSFTGSLPGGQKGKLDLAHGGTIFLDEIAEIPVGLQAKLLRFIQEREFYRVGGVKKIHSDVRIVCATNADLYQMVEQGSFRRDLYYRLNVGRIHVPPLRERPQDILPLADLFLASASREKKKFIPGISPAAGKMLMDHSWPGNVRELKNAMEWAVFTAREDYPIGPAHLAILVEDRAGGVTPAVTPSAWHDLPLPADGLSLEELVKRVVVGALKLKNGNKTEAARYLGISRRSLYCRLKQLCN